MDKRRAVFLDRDGVINKDLDYIYTRDKFIYLEGAIQGLAELNKMGFDLIIITNQSGIARGYYKEKDFKELNEWMLDDLSKKNVKILDVYYCPHHPEATVPEYRMVCNCRKPGTALFYRAAKEHNIDFASSFAIGDRERDLSICKETKVKGILLSNEYRLSDEYIICKNWEEILNAVKEN